MPQLFKTSLCLFFIFFKSEKKKKIKNWKRALKCHSSCLQVNNKIRQQLDEKFGSNSLLFKAVDFRIWLGSTMAADCFIASVSPRAGFCMGQLTPTCYSYPIQILIQAKEERDNRNIIKCLFPTF